MQNIISNKTRSSLGLKPIDSSWDVKRVDNCTFLYKSDSLQKIISTTEDKGEQKLTECDTNIKLDSSLNIISSRGKIKPLNLENVKKEKSKESILTINFSHKTILLECGVKWLPELSFSSVSTIDKDIEYQISNLYGMDNWARKVNLLKAKPTNRQNYKDGDIICIRLDAQKYVYALLIGSFVKLRKLDFWPSKQTGHYLCHLMCVPIVLRKFNFVSSKNDLSINEITKHGLLNPEIIMDDLLLRGTFKIVAHKKLEEEDILFPMHYSCYGTHKTGGQSSAHGMGIFDKEWKNNVKERLKGLISHYETIKIVYNWGFGAVEMDLHLFLSNISSDDIFIDSCSICGMIAGLDKEGQLINSETIFNQKKLERVFGTMNINPSIDFDSFNKKYGGLTRKEYLDHIK